MNRRSVLVMAAIVFILWWALRDDGPAWKGGSREVGSVVVHK